MEEDDEGEIEVVRTLIRESHGRIISMDDCHCGRDGHPLNSINCPAHRREKVDKVAWAINQAWNKSGGKPLYQCEAESLAEAAIDALEGTTPRCEMCGHPRDGRDHSGCDRAYSQIIAGGSYP